MHTTPLRVLLVDSHPADASHILSFLENNGEMDLDIFHMPTRAAAHRFLKDNPDSMDVIILDIFLVDASDPARTYDLFRRAAGETPMIVITDAEARQLAHEVTLNGAADIVIRETFMNYPLRLTDAIDFAIIRGRLMREMKQRQDVEAQQHLKMLHWVTGGYSIEPDAADRRKPGNANAAA